MVIDQKHQIYYRLQEWIKAQFLQPLDLSQKFQEHQ